MKWMRASFARCHLGALLLWGCGPQVEPRADCDGDGPTLLVELDAGPSSVSFHTGVRDERGWLFFDGEEHEGRNIAVECSERPRVFARNFPNVLRVDPRGPWLGLRQPPDQPPEVHVVDPWGERAPRPLPYRFLGVVDDGLLMGNDDRSDRVSLWHAKFGDAFELEPVELHLPTNASQRESWESESLFVVDPVETIFVGIGNAGERMTVGVDPRTGQTRFVEPLSFTRSKMGGRFVVLSNVEENVRLGYSIVDTQDPTRRIEWPADGNCCGSNPDVVALVRHEERVAVETHLVLLPELIEIRLEGEWGTWFQPVGTTGDARKVVRGPDGFYLIDPDDARPVHLYPGDGWSRIVDDTLWIVHIGSADGHTATSRDTSLVAVPLDGSPPVTVLPAPLAGHLHLPGGRWAFGRSTQDDDSVLDLVTLDPTSGREEIAVRDVTTFVRWNSDGLWGDAWSPSIHRIAPDDAIAFERRTSTGTEVWRVVP